MRYVISGSIDYDELSKNHFQFFGNGLINIANGEDAPQVFDAGV
jgi:hypothetical protein